MIKIALPPEVFERITSELRRAGQREIGGVLLAENVGVNQFVVREITVHRVGTFASFIRRIEEALGHVRLFFDKTRHQYRRYNYLGEWHSHPSFDPQPSGRDHSSMLEIVHDPSVGANFVILLIVKLDSSGLLVGSAHTYLPDGSIHGTELDMTSETSEA